MAYDADDPLNHLGRRSGPSMDTGLPSGPFRARGPLRGLTGDVRNIPNGGSAMLIDVEYETPRALLVNCQANELLSAGLISYTVRTGLDRSPLRADTVEQPADLVFNRIVVARSLQVIIQYPAGQPNPSVNVAAAVLPIDLNAEASSVLGFAPAIDRGPPNSALSFVAPESIVSATFDSNITVPAQVAVFGPGRRAGFSVYNNSASILYLNMGGVFAAPFAFTIPMAPGSYFEAPYNYSGPMAYVFAAAGPGTAQFAAFGFDQFVAP